jgi:hypothetical protein
MLWRVVVLEMRENAVPAEIDRERIECLYRTELVLCENGLADRQHAEIEKLGKRAAARLTSRFVIHRCLIRGRSSISPDSFGCGGVQ